MTLIAFNKLKLRSPKVHNPHHIWMGNQSSIVNANYSYSMYVEIPIEHERFPHTFNMFLLRKLLWLNVFWLATEPASGVLTNGCFELDVLQICKCANNRKNRICSVCYDASLGTVLVSILQNLMFVKILSLLPSAMFSRIVEWSSL